MHSHTEEEGQAGQEERWGLKVRSINAAHGDDRLLTERNFSAIGNYHYRCLEQLWDDQCVLMLKEVERGSGFPFSPHCGRSTF